MKSADIRKDFDPTHFLRALIGVANVAAGAGGAPGAGALWMITGSQPI
jgi:hypothetical protein